MTKITVYDIEAEQLDKIAEANNTTIAEIVELLMQHAEDILSDNNMNH